MLNPPLSLMQMHPKRVDVLALAVTAVAMLTAGLSLPVITLKKMVFWKDTYSILTGIQLLWHEREYVLAAVVFFFSVVFPYCKLTGLLVIWMAHLSDRRRRRALEWLGILGKWSMLDVFVVAVTVVVAKIGAIAEARPRAGIYVFAAAIFLSMILTMMVERLAKRNGLSGPARFSI